MRCLISIIADRAPKGTYLRSPWSVAGEGRLVAGAALSSSAFSLSVASLGRLPSADDRRRLLCLSMAALSGKRLHKGRRQATFQVRSVCRPLFGRCAEPSHLLEKARSLLADFAPSSKG
jgi:hypothetical protein